jgi:hypothetical protein
MEDEDICNQIKIINFGAWEGECSANTVNK